MTYSTLPNDLQGACARYNVRFISKKSSAWMRAIAWFLAFTKINPYFASDYFTTLPRLPWFNGVDVYYPGYIRNPRQRRYWNVLYHEILGHGPQLYGLRNGLRMLATWPLRWPQRWRGKFVWLSGIWLIERGPYLKDIQRGAMTLDQAVHYLDTGYGKPAPKDYMRWWFEERLK